MTTRILTANEKKWKAKLEGDPEYEIMPMSDLYPTLPDAEAYEQYEQRCGHADAAVWCKLMMTHEMTEMLRDVVVILHGTLNCNSCVRNFHSDRFGDYGHAFAHFPTTSIDRRHVIFGGEQALAEAIRAVDRDYKPKLIIVLPGCATSMVQDDIQRVCAKAQEDLGIRVYYFPCAGYEDRPTGVIIEKVTQMWVDLMDEPKSVDPEAVNILGANREVYWPHVRGAEGKPRPNPYPSDAEELGRMIEAIGLKVHRVLMASGGDYDYIRTTPEGGINTVLCGTWAFPIAEKMKERFGTKLIYNELPLGFEANDKFMRHLGEATGREKEAEQFIADEHEKINKVWEETKKMVAGKVCIMGAIGNRTGSYLRLCKDLGMDVVYTPAYPEMGFCNDETIKAKRVDWDYFLSDEFDPIVMRLKDGQYRDFHKFYLPVVMEKLGLHNDDMLYMYCDFSPYAGQIEPSNIAYVNTSTHLRRRPGYPSRAVGYRGTEGFCLDIQDAVKAAGRKKWPTLYTRIYQK